MDINDPDTPSDEGEITDDPWGTGEILTCLGGSGLVG